jgi:phage-related protein (TIGR01555 family)
MDIVDSLVNLVSGLGTPRDKASHSEFTRNDLGQSYLGILYRNWLFGKVVDIPADDMTRKWRTFKSPSLSMDELEQIKQAEKTLDVRGTVNTALKWARLYGGSVIILGVNDMLGSLEEPLDLEKIKVGDLQSLVVLDRFDCTAYGVTQNKIGETFRLPEFYQLPAGARVHHSRIIRFDGYKLPWMEFQRNQYWGGSICERVYDEILNVKTTTASISSMIFEASIDVVGVKNLFERIMNKQSLDSVLKRFQIASLTKSINRTLIIDKDQEDFTKHTTNFSGLQPLVSEFLSVVAAAADIPATRMLGASAKGFSATGEGDLKNYYDMISSKQETDLSDPMAVLDDVMVRSTLGFIPDDFSFSWNPLWQTTEKERAEINKLNSDTDAVNLQNGVIQPFHVSARILECGFYPTLDGEFVDAMEVAEKELAAEAASMPAFAPPGNDPRSMGPTLPAPNRTAPEAAIAPAPGDVEEPSMEVDEDGNPIPDDER